MSFLGILLLGGFLTPLTLSGIIYSDAKRRELPPSLRLLWVSIVGLISLGGFLVPYLYNP